MNAASSSRTFTAFVAAMLLSGVSAHAASQAVEISSANESQAGRQLCEAVVRGNIRAVDQLLASGVIGVDDVIVTGPEGNFHKFDGRLGRLAFKLWEYRSYMQSSMNGKLCYVAAGASTGTDGMVATRTDLHGTALMIAVRNRNIFMVKELLKRGANPNVFINVGSVVFKNSIAKARSVSGNTTWFGGKPYGGPLSQPYMPGQATVSNNSLNPNDDVVDYEVTRLCALTDLYGTGTPGTLQQDNAIAEMLVNAGAAFPKGEDDRGRTAIWDVAAVRSVYLIRLLHKNGWDVCHKDHMGKTVADYCVETLGKMAECDDRQMLLAFVKELGRLGCPLPSTMPEPQKIDVRPLGGNGNTTPTQGVGLNSGTSGYPAVSGSVDARSVADRSIERQAIQNQIDALRIELEDAKRNLHNDMVQGTGWVSADAHVQSIMREIQELQGQLMRLR